MTDPKLTSVSAIIKYKSDDGYSMTTTHAASPRSQFCRDPMLALEEAHRETARLLALFGRPDAATKATAEAVAAVAKFYEDRECQSNDDKKQDRINAKLDIERSGIKEAYPIGSLVKVVHSSGEFLATVIGWWSGKSVRIKRKCDGKAMNWYRGQVHVLKKGYTK